MATHSMGYPCISADKESACNAGNPASIPGLGRSPEEGMDYPLHNFLGFPGGSVGKKKNAPSMWEIWVPFLGWEDPLEEGMATHSSILAWSISLDRGA